MLRTKHFGNYEVIRKLARGMTDVYLAFDNNANRHAVLKIVEEAPDPLTQLILDAERRGAAIQRQLHDADSRVIEIYEYGELDGYFFVAMQYIEGRTVAELLKQEKRIDPARAAKFYGELFGWKATSDNDDDPASGYQHIQNGDDFIGGILPAEKDSTIPPHWLPYFQVANCDLSAAKAKELGAGFLLPPTTMENVGRMAVIADPQQAVFAVFQPMRKQ